MKRGAIFFAAVALAVTSLTAVAVAQTDGPVASGHFTGVVALDGFFTMDVPEGGYVTIFVNASGPLDLTLSDGTMSGPWSWSGEQQVRGTLGADGADGTALEVSGGGPISASGMLEGPPASYRMTGMLESTNTVNFAMQTATSSATEPLDEELTDVMVLCDTIVGRWDLRFKQEIEAAGFDQFIRGYFTASTGVDATEQAKATEELVKDVSRWASEAPGLEPGDRGLYIGRALSLLNRSQVLQAELATKTPCPPDPTFATELALATQDVLNTLLDRYPGIMNSTLVSLALGSGAIGAGSPSPAASAALGARTEADLNQKIDALVDGLPDTASDLIDTARAAQLMGMETVGEAGALSPSDVLLVVTGSSS